MATIKHLSSKNSDLGAAERYLIFQHDESSNKPILDADGHLIPREDYRIDSVLCGDEDFAIACMKTNLAYNKNLSRGDVKTHHYIISFDPRDAEENGLTMDRAQELGLEFCKKHFPGHQALVCTYVLARIQHWCRQVQQNEEQTLEHLLKAGDKERAAAAKKQTSDLKKAEKRRAEVDRAFVKLYEDWAAERITEYNFNMLSQKYQAEQEELEQKIQTLKTDMNTVKGTAENAEKWIELIKKVGYPKELNAELLNTLIEKILIHEATKDEFGTRNQDIEIIYRFVGKID